MTIRFDFSGLEQFLACLEGRVSPEQVFAHPAYQTVALHARQFGTGLNARDVENALAGPPRFTDWLVCTPICRALHTC